MELKMYTAPETVTTDSKHHVRLKFQYGDHTATLETYTLGNISGGDVLNCYTDLETGFSVPINHPLTAKHAVFSDDDDFEPHHVCREVDSITLIDEPGPNKNFVRPPVTISLDEAQRYLVGVEIIGYEDVTEDED